MKKIGLLILLFSAFTASGQQASFKIGLLKYSGGGDWYANPTSLPNLIEFCNRELQTGIYKEPETVEAGSQSIFNYPFVHLTGHGNIIFSEAEAENLRLYLLSGGFLHADDNYGIDKYFRREMKKVFPEKEWVELPFSHPLFHKKYDFPNGLPKIHEHDNKPPQAFALYEGERMICLYTYECDLGDGWEDPSVHNDPQEIRLKALRMGANIIHYVFTE